MFQVVKRIVFALVPVLVVAGEAALHAFVASLAAQADEIQKVLSGLSLDGGLGTVLATIVIGAVTFVTGRSVSGKALAPVKKDDPNYS